MAIKTAYSDWTRLTEADTFDAFTVENVSEHEIEFVFSAAQPDNAARGNNWDIVYLKPGVVFRFEFPYGFRSPLWYRCRSRETASFDLLTRVRLSAGSIRTIAPVAEGDE